jgi:predicted ATP-grasp superfamily ATP-dependent carboligase
MALGWMHDQVRRLVHHDEIVILVHHVNHHAGIGDEVARFIGDWAHHELVPSS